MLDARSSATDEEYGQLIFYANTTPLIAAAGHPIIADALDHATSNVLSADDAFHAILPVAPRFGHKPVHNTASGKSASASAGHK